jgi:hypothetical protein
VKIMADLGQAPELRLNQMVMSAPPAAQKAGAVLYEQLVVMLPPSLARERIVALAQISVHMCADRARLEDDPEESRTHVPGGVFVENLVDMVTGALFAPLSATVQRALGDPTS